MLESDSSDEDEAWEPEVWQRSPPTPENPLNNPGTVAKKSNASNSGGGEQGAAARDGGGGGGGGEGAGIRDAEKVGPKADLSDVTASQRAGEDDVGDVRGGGGKFEVETAGDMEETGEGGGSNVSKRSRGGSGPARPRKNARKDGVRASRESNAGVKRETGEGARPARAVSGKGIVEWWKTG